MPRDVTFTASAKTTQLENNNILKHPVAHHLSANITGSTILHAIELDIKLLKSYTLLKVFPQSHHNTSIDQYGHH
jgi:hypothetical protein